MDGVWQVGGRVEPVGFGGVRTELDGLLEVSHIGWN